MKRLTDTCLFSLMSTTVTLLEGDFRAIIAMVGPPTYLQHSQRVGWFDQLEALSLQGEEGTCH